MRINEEILKKIDKKLEHFGLNFTQTRVKPCLNKYLVNKEKNSIIFAEKEINDECNYIFELHLLLNYLDPKKPLYFISFVEFIPAVILFYLQLLSKDHKIYIFSADSDEIQEYSTDNLKIFNLEKAEEFELIKKKKD